MRTYTPCLYFPKKNNNKKLHAEYNMMTLTHESFCHILVPVLSTSGEDKNTEEIRVPYFSIQVKNTHFPYFLTNLPKPYISDPRGPVDRELFQ